MADSLFSTYDVFLAYLSSVNKSPVASLVRDLRVRGYRVFDEAEMSLGPSYFRDRSEALEKSRRAILVVTEGGIDSGWLRREYRNLRQRCRKGVDFDLVLVTFGEWRDDEAPFLDSDLVEIRDDDQVGRGQALDRLCSRLGPATFADDVALATKHPEALTIESQGSDDRFVNEVFNLLTRTSIIMLLGQAHRDQREVVSALKERSCGFYGAENVLHITPPYSHEADLSRYFTRLGRQCRFEEDIADSLDWDEALDRRLAGNERLLLLVSSFENGSDAGRQELAGVLRSHIERHGGHLRLVLCGGERLAELKYSKGELSLLNIAEVMIWPEVTEADVKIRLRRERVSLAFQADEDLASTIHLVCGGHPRLIESCIRQLRMGVGAAREELNNLLRVDHAVWQLFTPYLENPAMRERICEWLRRDDLGPYQPWPVDSLLRHLYWQNLIVERSRRFLWRCSILQEVGREALACGS